MTNDKIRNVAIIAHVDHGKTTLVDQLLKQGGAFRSNQVVAERVMDSEDQERERGITILAKNTSVKYGDIKINIVDTPGHADFGGEVERILKMVNGVVLLVDAYEGTMPQTRFVLKKALDLGHKVIVAINKIDKIEARISEVEDEVLELLMDLNASNEQLESPFIYCSGRAGTASTDKAKQGTDLKPLFDLIISYIDPPSGDTTKSAQMLVSALDYNDYVGKIAIGRIERGALKLNQNVSIVNYNDKNKIIKTKLTAIFQFEGLNRVQVESANAGDIVCVSGVEGVTIGDTICDPTDMSPIEFPKISEPSVEMTFLVNDSPFAGKEGKFVTSRQLRERLYKETLKDVSIKVYDTDSSDAFRVCGRGEMHLSVMIEKLRREGFEFQISMPKVLFREIDGKKCEPIDKLIVDVAKEYSGVVIEKMGQRKGVLLQMSNVGTRMRLEFEVPSRGLFGYKSEFMTDTKGEGVMNSIFDRYDVYRGEIERRKVGSLIAFETGVSVAYGLFNAQERGQLFIGAGVQVYKGMVVGACSKAEDIVVNVCKRKQLTNMRASGSDEALRLTPHVVLSLEQSIEFIADDEYLEITPKNIRIRKKILDASLRAKSNKG